VLVGDCAKTSPTNGNIPVANTKAKADKYIPREIFIRHLSNLTPKHLMVVRSMTFKCLLD